MIRGVIFDVDGVLLNSMPAWQNLGELYLKRCGIEAEKGLDSILYSLSLEEAADYLKSHYSLPGSPEEIIRGITMEIKDFYVKRVPLKEGVRQYLQEFRERKIPMAVATAGDRENAEAALKRLKVWTHFEGIYTCSDIGSSKSQPDIYYTAALRLDTEPSETWVFEDALHAIRTAQKAGFKTVGIYDRANDRDLAQIWKTADIYLPEFKDFDQFWVRASES